MRRHILSQGNLDGACFLYSVINAYITLSNREPGNERWDKRFYDRWDRPTGLIPYLSDFFQCGSENEHSGTGRYNDDPRLFAYTTERILQEMCTEAEKDRFNVAIRDDKKEPRSLKGLIHQASVVIVCPNSNSGDSLLNSASTRENMKRINCLILTSAAIHYCASSSTQDFKATPAQYRAGQATRYVQSNI